MSKILIIFAHPRPEKSRTDAAFVTRISEERNITFNDLYEQFPNFDINVEQEKQLLPEHEIIIWQHPLS